MEQDYRLLAFCGFTFWADSSSKMKMEELYYLVKQTKKKVENTLSLFKNAAFTVNIINNVFKHQFES